MPPASASTADGRCALRSAGVPAAKEYALWSLSLCVEEANQKTIVDEGGIRPLVNTLMAKTVAQQEQAAEALARLAFGSSETQIAIAKEGGIAPLIALLDVDMGSVKTQIKAAAALADLALRIENKEAILAAGGISPLVALLSDGGTEAKQCAATPPPLPPPLPTPRSPTPLCSRPPPRAPPP